MRLVEHNNAAAVLEANNLFLNSANLQWKYLNAFEMNKTREYPLFSYFTAHFKLNSLMFYKDKQLFGSNYIVSERNCAVNVKNNEIALCFLKD